MKWVLSLILLAAPVFAQEPAATFPPVITFPFEVRNYCGYLAASQIPLLSLTPEEIASLQKPLEDIESSLYSERQAARATLLAKCDQYLAKDYFKRLWEAERANRTSAELRQSLQYVYESCKSGARVDKVKTKDHIKGVLTDYCSKESRKGLPVCANIDFTAEVQANAIAQLKKNEPPSIDFQRYTLFLDLHCMLSFSVYDLTPEGEENVVFEMHEDCDCDLDDPFPIFTPKPTPTPTPSAPPTTRPTTTTTTSTRPTTTTTTSTRPTTTTTTSTRPTTTTLKPAPTRTTMKPVKTTVTGKLPVTITTNSPYPTTTTSTEPVTPTSSTKKPVTITKRPTTGTPGPKYPNPYQ